MAYQNINTPVLVFADLPQDLQLADGNLGVRPKTRNRYIAAVRCQARSRGDSVTAKMLHIPRDGGHRCPNVVHDWGLCRVHCRHATNSVRQRALELHLDEQLAAPTTVTSVPTEGDEK